jgi:hypothetical protein
MFSEAYENKTVIRTYPYRQSTLRIGYKIAG